MLSEIFLIPIKTEQDIIINIRKSSRKIPLVLSDFKCTWNFRDRLSKNIEISKYIKLLYVFSVYFVEFYYICPTHAQYMLTIICFLYL